MTKLPTDTFFQEFQERHYQYHVDFRSVDIKVIEVEGFQTDTPAMKSFLVRPGRVKDWLTKVFPRDPCDSTMKLIRDGQDSSDIPSGREQRRPKLRVILGYLGIGAKYDYMMHGERLAPRDVFLTASITTLPFSEDNYRLICDRLTLPRITSLLLTRGARPLRGHFQLVRMMSEEKNLIYGLAMGSFSSLLVGLKISVSMSYNPATGIINAVLLGNGSDDGLAWLHQDLEHLSALADNLFLVPTLICQRLSEVIFASIDDNFDQLHQVEIGSGQTGIMMFGENGMPMPRGNCEDPNLSTAILGVGQQALAIEAYIRGHMLTVNSVKKELLEFPWQEFPSVDYDRVREQSEFLEKQLDFISRTLDFALIRVGHLKQRSNMQATAITNLLAQRNNETNRRLAESSTSIARDTRRDSSAMKSIAILTMVFLPATFTAVSQNYQDVRT
ncbi:hypothetical protein M434DRAFT_9766 [Hypoxylon sp. CO27-5]|nr:hypothetical protein M434DRAFT_9766 [Hypoxylon sp. CO27-5]